MKAKRVKTAAAALLSAALLSGCYPTGNEEPRSDIVSGESPASNSENISSGQTGVISAEDSSQQAQKSISYNITLPQNPPSTVSQIRLQVRKWKENEIESIFLDGKTVAEQYTYEPDFFPNDLCYVYKTSDDWQIIRAPGQFTADNMAVKNGEFQYSAVCDPLKSVCFASDEELSVFSSEDAIKRVNEILDRLKIPYGTPYVIPVKADAANEYLGFCAENYENFSYTPWEQENEVYILKYPLLYDGIELTMYDMKILGANDFGSGASIDAVVSKNDIISLRGRTIFQAEYETEEQISVKYNADFCLNKIKEFYSPQIISEETQFFDCKIVYVPVKKESEEYLSVAPAWEFDGDTQIGTFPFKQPISQYVYAHNGNRYSEF